MMSHPTLSLAVLLANACLLPVMHPLTETFATSAQGVLGALDTSRGRGKDRFRWAAAVGHDGGKGRIPRTVTNLSGLWTACSPPLSLASVEVSTCIANCHAFRNQHSRPS